MAIKALITGVTGQDGRYLAELLLQQGYEVHGLTRPRAERAGGGGIQGPLPAALTLHAVSLGDAPAVRALLETVAPGQIYHFSAQSSVAASFRDPAGTFRSNIEDTQNLFAAIRDVAPATRTYFAASCEMFGRVQDNPATEQTAFRPVSPYGIAKLTAYELARYYRDAWHVPITCGIAFNHDSPLRSADFFTGKIAQAAARIAAGQQRSLAVGNLDVWRDWGYAPEYVTAMWQLMTRAEPGDFILATGRSASLEELLCAAFQEVALDWRAWTHPDPALFRPADIHTLYGDPAKIQRAIGWQAATHGPDVLRIMVRRALETLRA